MLKNLLNPTNPFAPRNYGELKKVTDRVYIFRNITNSSFVVGDQAVAVIDTQVNYPTAEIFLKHLRSVTDKPIRYVINTHYHWDHTNGNELFKSQGAEIISSKLTKEFMVSRAPRQKEFLAGRGFELGKDPLLPETVFENEYTVDLGNMPLRLFFAGRAETDDATAVHVVNEEVVMAGDTVMTGSFPIFGQPVWDEGLQGDEQWIETIKRLTLLKPRHIVPGHGPLAYEKEIELLIRIERYFMDEVGALLKKGYLLTEVLDELEAKLPSWITKIPVVWGTPRYAILRVYRGLTKMKGDAEPGWQKMKPNAIPSKNVENIADDDLAMAHEAAEGGDDALRLSILKKLCAELPERLDAWTTYADALIEVSRKEASVLEKGDFFSEAKKAWAYVLSRDPRNVPALLGKGRYYVMMAYRGGEDPSVGMKLLESLLDKNPAGRVKAEALFYLGMGHRRLFNEKIAHQFYSRALEADPGFMPARLASQV